MPSSNAGRVLWGFFLFGTWIVSTFHAIRFGIQTLWVFIRSVRGTFRDIGIGQIVADVMQLILGVGIIIGIPILIAWLLFKLNQKVKGVPHGP